MSPRVQTTKGCLFVRNIPAGVKDRFKAACASRRVTMENVVAALLDLWVRDAACVRVVPAGTMKRTFKTVNKEVLTKLALEERKARHEENYDDD